MKRIKLKERKLPKYTKGEEIFNMVTHIVGGALGVIAFILCIIFAAIHNNTFGIVSGMVYGISMILLYTISSVYHGLKPNTTAKKVLQVLDHCTIFLLIAGSYTPFLLCIFRPVDPILCWVLFTIIWGFAVLGVVLNGIDLERYKVFSVICYVAMGWCIIIKITKLPSMLGIPGFILLLSGGIAYTIGIVFYGLGRTIKYMHSIFHLFIVLGSLLHFLCILMYVM